VVDELESDFLDEIAAAIKNCKSDAVIIGEVWEDASNKSAYGERKRYFLGSQLDSVMNYPLRNAVIELVTGGDAGFFALTAATLYRHYPVEKQRYLLNFLGSHDTERITTLLGAGTDQGEPNDVLAHRRLSKSERARAIKLLECAYTLIAAMPGVPCIFYGDEIAMEGYHDPFNRRPFPESGFDDECSAPFARVNAARASEREYFLLPELSVEAVGEHRVIVTRRGGGKTMFIIVNMENSPFEFRLPVPTVDIFDGKTYTESVTVGPENIILLKGKEV